jgi:hypothetical protein
MACTQLCPKGFLIPFNYKDRNPVDHIGFFSKLNPNQVCQIGKELVSELLPVTFKEVTCRVFARESSKQAEIQFAFRKLIDNINVSYLRLGNTNELLSQSQEFRISTPHPGPQHDDINPFFSPKHSPSVLKSHHTWY